MTWIIDELSFARLRSNAHSECLDRRLALMQVSAELFVNCAHRLKGINFSMRGLLRREQAEKSYVGPDIENAGAFIQLDPMSQVSPPRKNFVVEIFSLVVVLLRHNHSIRQAAGVMPIRQPWTIRNHIGCKAGVSIAVLCCHYGDITDLRMAQQHGF